MQANWKLLVENSIDGYHASSTHDTCFKYLVWLGADLRRPGRRRHQGSERWPRGAGIPGAPGPRGRQAGTAVRAPKQVIEALRTRLAAEHGAERARRICDFNRNMLVCPWRVRHPGQHRGAGHLRSQ
jgi:p-cumate 2,3-dioxygenase subunit alpha